MKEYFIGKLIHNESNPYELARINTNYYFSFYGFICFISVFIVAFFLKAYPVMIPSGVSALFCIIHLYVLKTTKNTTVSSIVFSVLIYTILFGNMFFNKETLHFGGAFWIIVLIIFAAFNLGKKWGIVIAVISVLTFAGYTSFVLKEDLQNAINFPDIIYYALGLEAGVALIIIFYLMNTFIKTNKLVAEQLRITNLNLEKQNKIVNEQHHEKIIMLKEIHHRVKNNLQVISSMLRLQSGKINNNTNNIDLVFEDAQNRIQAMALVHQRMYQTENIAKINAESYLKELALDLLKLHATNQEVDLTIKATINNFNMKHIVPMGLVLNELISNSLKHGIKEKGKMNISFTQEHDKIIFEYQDNGVGFDDIKVEKGFGLDLIDVFTSQMDSNFTLITSMSNGVKYTFSIPVN